MQWPFPKLAIAGWQPIAQFQMVLYDLQTVDALSTVFPPIVGLSHDDLDSL